MIHKKHPSVHLIKGSIIRNSKGLALSSRNNYLSKKDRLTASNIYKSLMNIKNALSNGNKKTASLKKIFSDYINDFSGFSIDYISIADTQTLEEIPMVDRRVLISTAVVLDKVRLIDNFIYSPST
jgi:pantoate--beta-alanine ligase